MSKPSLRLVLWKLLVLYLNFLPVPAVRSQHKFQATAQTKLSYGEVSALDTIRDQWKLTGLSPDDYCSGSKKPGDDISITIICNCTYYDITVCHVIDINGRSVGLTGVIPNEVGEFQYMRTLDLSYNQLTGPIPDTLGRAESLRFLDLSYNQLTGSIPDTLGRAENLTSLSLNFNKLSGLMPDIFENMTSLDTLDIDDNRFRGPLPRTLGNLKGFTSFRAIGNSFSGPIPKTYEKLINLQYFQMCGNDLSGPLPVSIMKHWSKIFDLSLQGNNFTGDSQSMKVILNFPNLQYLRITDLGSPSIKLPSEITNKKYILLTLRNCSITGPIPKYIGQMTDLKFLDLSFNSLTGGLPEMGSGLDYMSFSSNKLNGIIPEWVFQPVNTEIDLSFNKFSATDSPTPENRDVNLFACCENSTDTYPYRRDSFKMVDQYCQGNKQKYNSLFINCGGGEKIVNGITYEQDNDTARFFTSPKQNWAYSSSGDYWQANVSASDYIKNMTCGVSVDDAPLYDRARLSPVSLKYYAFCLREGKYTVSLKFAEIIYSKNDDYTSLRKRAFTIYIQDDKNNALYDFDIAAKAGGPDKPFTKNFTAEVKKETNTLSIHMYWRGKGSFIHLGPGLYGPLISAISVTPEFKIPDEKKVPFLHIALIVIGSTILPVLLLLGFAWKISQRWKYSIKIKVGEEKDVPLRELIAATGRFSKKEIIGRGNLGKVYTAKLQGPNKTTYTVAVKKLSSRNFKENIRSLKMEIKLLYELSHENLIKLFDYHIDKDLQLLVYEYMENGSLENALTVDSNSRSLKFDWNCRYNICLGIARGLQYLHEHRKLNIAHMNIKAVNILLDGDLQPKISDFGFSHLFVDENQLKAIKREVTQGYMAPEYFQGYLTMKSDVYSFGVILLEIVSWKKNVTSTNLGTEVLVNTANEKYEQGTLRDMIDQTLEGCKIQEALTILKLAIKCTNIAPSVRPSISDVVSVLSGEKKIEDLSRSAAPNAVEKNLEEAPHVGEEIEGTPNVGEKTKDIEEGPSTNFRRQQTAYHDSLGSTSMKR